MDIIAKLKSDLAIFLKKHGSEKLSLSVKQELNSLDSIRAKHEENARQLRNKADSIAEEIESTSNDILEF